MTGTLTIVGLGPGGPAHRTDAATQAIRDAAVVVGYGPYVDQCADLLADQEVVRGAMGEEAARADEALARACAGARVALVSSGDPGVYGMAARTLARVADLDPGRRPVVAVVPGVSAAHAAAALVGAPLADDHAVVSLSELHLDAEEILRRLRHLARSGVALALYNPRSRTRHALFDQARELLRDERGDDTPVVLVTDAARSGERVERTTLGALDPARIGMRTVVLVAGASSTEAGPWLVARRGTVVPA